jgi:hypothetical protein
MMSTDGRDTRRFLVRLASAYRRARARRVGDSWTIDPPAWWVDTSTVARRRLLTEQQRGQWLRRQVA